MTPDQHRRCAREADKRALYALDRQTARQYRREAREHRLKAHTAREDNRP